MGAPAKKGMGPVVPILIVVALIAVGVGAFFLLSGDDDSGSNPESVVEAFFAAGRNQDCGAAIALFSPSSIEASPLTAEQLTAECESSVAESDDDGLFTPDLELVSTEVTEESDTSATVQATYRQGGEEDTDTYQVVNEDGEWRIDFGAFAGEGSSGGGDTPPTSEPGGGTDTTSGGSSGPSGPTTSGGGSGGNTSGAAPPEVLAQADNQEEINLANACASGDMTACDDLWPRTPSGSLIEAFSESCGGRDPGGNNVRTCQQNFG